MWLRLEDNMLDHPKWRRALRQGGDAVVAVWVRLTSWCSRHLTDGEIPADMVDEVAESRGDRSRRRALQALIDCSLLARRETGACSIVDYLERNPSRRDVLAARDAAARRKRKHRDGSAVTAGLHEESHDPATPRRNYPIPIPIHPDPIPVVEEELAGASDDHDHDHDPHECETIPAPADETAETPEPRERVLEPVDDGWQSPFPPEAEGTPPVWRSLRGWEPSDELYAEAKVQGVSKDVFDRQLAKLRNGPIGGSRGVFDRDDYVRLQIPHWRTWDETDRAKASLAPPGFRSGFRGSGAPPLEPSKRHLAFAEKHAIAIAPIVNGLALEGVVDALGHKGALEELGRRLLAARKAKEAAA